MIYLILYFCTGLALLAWAFRYLFSRTFLPYHAEATGFEWQQLDPKIQLLILALMRAVGAGLLAISVFIIASSVWLHYNNDTFLRLAVPTVIVFVMAGLSFVSYMIYRKTKANTPWKNGLVSLVLNLTALFLTLWNIGQ